MDIETLKGDIEAWQPVKWDSMPDIELYMDQVVTYLERQLALFQGENEGGIVTRSIINNYVKDGLVPRPVNKRYAREQLSALMMACVLKRVLPMQQVRQLLSAGSQEGYAAFSASLKQALDREAEQLQEKDDGSLKELALRYALRAAASCLMADRLLAMAGQEEAAKKEEKKDRTGK